MKVTYGITPKTDRRAYLTLDLLLSLPPKEISTLITVTVIELLSCNTIFPYPVFWKYFFLRSQLPALFGELRNFGIYKFTEKLILVLEAIIIENISFVIFLITNVLTVFFFFHLYFESSGREVCIISFVSHPSYFYFI